MNNLLYSQKSICLQPPICKSFSQSLEQFSKQNYKFCQFVPSSKTSVCSRYSEMFRDSDFAHFLKNGIKLKRLSEIKTPLRKLLNILKKLTMTGNPNQKTTSFQPKQTQILFTILLRRFLISSWKWRIRRKIGDFPNAIWTFLRLWDLHLFSTGRGAF